MTSKTSSPDTAAEPADFERALAELEPSTTAFLYVHHHIREADQQLFGFLARDERTTFQTLIGTHGVGPALGMAIIATHPPVALVDIVANQARKLDEDRFPGAVALNNSFGFGGHNVALAFRSYP